MEDPGFMARASQRVDSEHGGEVDEDRGDRRDRHPTPRSGAYAGTARSMGSDPGDATLGVRCHLRPRRSTFEDAEEVGSRASAQNCAVAAGEDRREVSRLDARGSVTDSIDSAVLAQTKTEGEGFEPSVRQ